MKNTNPGKKDLDSPGTAFRMKYARKGTCKPCSSAKIPSIWFEIIARNWGRL